MMMLNRLGIIRYEWRAGPYGWQGKNCPVQKERKNSYRQPINERRRGRNCMPFSWFGCPAGRSVLPVYRISDHKKGTSLGG